MGYHCRRHDLTRSSHSALPNDSAPRAPEGSFTKEAGKLSEPSISKPYGRRNTMNGSSAPRQSCPSGSERDPAKRLAIPSPLKMRRMLESRLHLLTTMLKKRKKRKRKKRRRKKTNK